MENVIKSEKLHKIKPTSENIIAEASWNYNNCKHKKSCTYILLLIYQNQENL